MNPTFLSLSIKTARIIILSLLILDIVFLINFLLKKKREDTNFSIFILIILLLFYFSLIKSTQPSFTISWYGVMFATGFGFGYYLILRRAVLTDIAPDIFNETFFIILVLSMLVGARSFFIILNWRRFVQAPLSLIFSRSGLVFFGGFIFSILSLAIYFRLLRQNLWHILDTIIPSLAFGHAIGRIGCFLNGCCFGRICSAQVPFSFEFPGMYGIRFPTQLFESFFNFLLFISLTLFFYRKKFNGQIFLLYGIIYSAVRFANEFMRGDYEQLYFFDLTFSQVIVLFIMPIFIISYIFLFFKSRNRILEQENS